MHDVFINPKSLKTLVLSAVEVYNRETNGFIAGKPVLKKIRGKEKAVISLQTVYPLQTAERKPSQVVHGNDLAHRRAIASLSAMKIPIIGGFHSHTDYHPTQDAPPELSKGDLDHIHDEMKNLKTLRKGREMRRWLEIILSIKKKSYSKSQKNKMKINSYKKRLGCTVITEPYKGYKITLAGYWIQNISAKTRVRKEAKIYSNA